jgi:hypothetical protein
MLATPSTPKIRASHLERQAVVYVRQSTLVQVREHTGSATRQYDLAQRARDLGWSSAHIQLIDQDQGQSGASATFRDGFQQVVAAVGLGRVGAVFCLDASRLARSCSDWYHLLEICALTDTLVVDEDGVYDPGQYNDRLLLGFKRPAARDTSCSTRSRDHGIMGPRDHSATHTGEVRVLWLHRRVTRPSVLTPGCRVERGRPRPRPSRRQI